MYSEKMLPGQDPDEFLYEFDTRQARFNACDPPESLTDQHYQDIILHNLSPEYERIRIFHLEKTDFGITDIRRMLSAIYATNLTRSSSSKGIAGRVAPMTAVERDRSCIICHYCERNAATFRKTAPSAPNTSSNKTNGSN